MLDISLEEVRLEPASHGTRKTSAASICDSGFREGEEPGKLGRGIYIYSDEDSETGQLCPGLGADLARQHAERTYPNEVAAVVQADCCLQVADLKNDENRQYFNMIRDEIQQQVKSSGVNLNGTTIDHLAYAKMRRIACAAQGDALRAKLVRCRLAITGPRPEIVYCIFDPRSLKNVRIAA